MRNHSAATSYCTIGRLTGVVLTLCWLSSSPAVSAEDKDLSTALKELDDKATSAGDLTKQTLARMLNDDIRARMQAANELESSRWYNISSRTQWELYKVRRIAALRKSLGAPPAESDLKTRVTATIKGEGYVIENTLFLSRPGLWVTANVYLPEKPGPKMPGILIFHSHHSPKTQGELQDMGILWARLGCVVLVMDQLGHGERREHPFVDASSYPGMFRVGRQDYYFRYNTAAHLHLIGESLIGWMVQDMRSAVDLLLARKDVDPGKIILLGAVAGGGDPAGVAAALDDRIAAVAPFNFGGPQPETRYPLPDNAEDTFNYAGGGSWESTRNLRLSARDGFLPWVIVGSVAPRRLIHAHEFAWDRERDPVWKRYQKIYSLYDKADFLSAATGKGKLLGSPPESTHCNNIGREHRKEIYAAFKRWFDIPVPEKENDKRHMSSELLCWTEAAKGDLKPKRANQLAREIAREQVEAARKAIEEVREKDQRAELRRRWSALLGDVESRGATTAGTRTTKLGDVQAEYVLLDVEDRIQMPLLLLHPKLTTKKRAAVVVCVAQEGKKEFLRRRHDMIVDLLKKEVAVCLVDVRGTGETSPGSGRSRTSGATSLSASEQMLGQTLLGARLRDLRTTLRYLRRRPEIEGTRMVVWGDSFAQANAADDQLAVPLDVEKQPHLAEPLGGLLALFACLYEENLRGALGRGGLINYQSVLENPFFYVPHDALVPGATTAGDLDLARELVGERLLETGRVDGRNRAVRDAVPVESVTSWILEKLKD